MQRGGCHCHTVTDDVRGVEGAVPHQIQMNLFLWGFVVTFGKTVGFDGPDLQSLTYLYAFKDFMSD